MKTECSDLQPIHRALLGDDWSASGPPRGLPAFLPVIRPHRKTLHFIVKSPRPLSEREGIYQLWRTIASGIGVYRALSHGANSHWMINYGKRLNKRS
jgi:hypothetical protein